ncbi:MAG: complex I subunit 4 family protein [Planctomycetota bacterium]
MSYVLLISVLLPLIGALVPIARREPARWLALVVTVVTFALTCVVAAAYPGGSERFAEFEWAWLAESQAPLDIRFSLALDGLSVWLYALTGLLMISSVLISWNAISEQASLYYRLLLVLETGVLGVFTAQDIILFYVFFEFTLIPLFFLIGIWGSEERRYAAVKFFLFTLAGSLLTFLGLLAVVLWVYAYGSVGQLTFSIPQLTESLAANPMPSTVQIWIFLALFAGFAIKVPLFPLHTWLPLAHVQAPAAGSVILAGLLLKIGTYGFVRFNLPMLPDATALLMPWMLWLAVAGIVYGALVALAQTDIKRLIAYSSVSHLGFCMLGIFGLTALGLEGGVLQMVNHGLSTGGLFALVGMIYERYHTRKMADLGGIARRTPILAFFMLVMTLASIGLPGLNGFVGEFLILLGMFERGFTAVPDAAGIQFRVISVLAVFGVVLGAWYMLYLVQHVFFGPLKEPHSNGGHGNDHTPVRDLDAREIAALVPLVAVIVWIGVYPKFFLEPMQPTLRGLSRSAAAALDRYRPSADTAGATGFASAVVPRSESHRQSPWHASIRDVPPVLGPSPQAETPGEQPL